MGSQVILRKPLAAKLLQLLLMIAVCLPTGSIFGLNVKMVVFGFFLLAFIVHLATSTSEGLNSTHLIGIALFVGSLCFWSLLGITYGQLDKTQILLQLKDISSTVLLAWLCIFFVRRRMLRPEDVIKPIIYGSVALAAMKLALIALTFGPKLDPIQLVETVFGEDTLVGGSIAFGLTRVEFPCDIVGTFVIFAVLCPSVSGIRFSRFIVALDVFLLIASGIFAYARYIWFLEAVAIIAAMIIERKYKWVIVGALAIGATAYLSTEALQSAVGSRFVSQETSESDQARIEQSRALFEEIEAHPLLGKGLGAHTDTLIRSERLQYSYELQWMALAMQFGFVGIAGFIALLTVSVRDLLAVHHHSKPWLLLLFALWVLSGWTNPYLTSSFAGAVFGMFMAIFCRTRMIATHKIEAVGRA